MNNAAGSGEEDINGKKTTSFEDCHGCNLVRAQECLAFMRLHPPQDCHFDIVSASPQPQCCSAYEPTVRCIGDVGCGNHEVTAELFTSCQHHACVTGCECEIPPPTHTHTSSCSLATRTRVPAAIVFHDVTDSARRLSPFRACGIVPCSECGVQDRAVGGQAAARVDTAAGAPAPALDAIGDRHQTQTLAADSRR